MSECALCGWTNGKHDPMYFCGREVYQPGYQFDTSGRAFDEIQPEIPAARLLALKHLARGPCTGGEANRALAPRDGNPSYHRRLAELVDIGLAERTRKRPCLVSGRAAWEFAITEKGRTCLRRNP